jgi:hypothetical protein
MAAVPRSRPAVHRPFPRPSRGRSPLTARTKDPEAVPDVDGTSRKTPPPPARFPPVPKKSGRLRPCPRAPPGPPSAPPLLLPRAPLHIGRDARSRGPGGCRRRGREPRAPPGKNRAVGARPWGAHLYAVPGALSYIYGASTAATLRGRRAPHRAGGRRTGAGRGGGGTGPRGSQLSTPGDDRPLPVIPFGWSGRVASPSAVISGAPVRPGAAPYPPGTGASCRRRPLPPHPSQRVTVHERS